MLLSVLKTNSFARAGVRLIPLQERLGVEKCVTTWLDALHAGGRKEVHPRNVARSEFLEAASDEPAGSSCRENVDMARTPKACLLLEVVENSITAERATKLF